MPSLQVTLWRIRRKVSAPKNLVYSEFPGVDVDYLLRLSLLIV